MDERYTVLAIYEDDYGCEERRPGEEPQVLVALRDCAGGERMCRQADAWLYRQDIREGDTVILRDGRLEKV